MNFEQFNEEDTDKERNELLEDDERIESKKRLNQLKFEDFADKFVDSFSDDQKVILENSAKLAEIDDLDDLPFGLSDELAKVINKYKDDYKDFKRQEDPSFLFRDSCIKNYNDNFKVSIGELKKKIENGDLKNLSEYLGSGSNGSAFKVKSGDKDYVAKFGSITQLNFELKPLIRALGISNVAQLTAYSFEDKVVIMELLKGKDVSTFTLENAPVYTEEHVIGLIDKVCELDSKGIVIDPKVSNFMYDGDQGFSILDFHLKNMKSSLPGEVMNLRHVLTYRKFEKLDYKASDYREKAEEQEIEMYRIFLPEMIRFLSILKEKYPDILNEWLKKDEEHRNDPSMSVPELIPREYISKYEEFDPYLRKLEDMGF